MKIGREEDFDAEDDDFNDDDNFDEFDEDDEDGDERPSQSKELIAAQGARWDELETADSEGRITLFLKTLEESEPMVCCTF
jgi:hypothetical protein